jgi:glucosamine-6-phosphate deaminase
MLVEIFSDYESMSDRAFELVLTTVRQKPDAVLGFATGSTPLGLYQRLISAHRDRGLDFSKMTTFNLDEYVGLPPGHEESYHYFMWENLFKHINVTQAHVHIPDGMAEDIEDHCEWYEQRIRKVGGIDVQILGMGVNGHLAFNEPGSSLGSRTRIKRLTSRTREDNARFFGGLDQVPEYAITMGIGTIMEARRILLMVSGKAKARAVKAMLEGPISALVPATIVQLHRWAYVLLDEDAASELEMRHSHGVSEPITDL